MTAPSWWTPPWHTGRGQDPDAGWSAASAPTPGDARSWHETAGLAPLSDEAILGPLEAQFGQVRSKDRVRDLAEVFTHQREVDAMLDLIPDAFAALDVKFLEPACGSGNFLTEILRRKLRLVAKQDCVSQEQYEHRLLRAAASIYGVDISPKNVTEARARLAHLLLEHYQTDANTIEPTPGFLHAAALILGDNIVLGDTLNAADELELCDWQPWLLTHKHTDLQAEFRARVVQQDRTPHALKALLADNQALQDRITELSGQLAIERETVKRLERVVHVLTLQAQQHDKTPPGSTHLRPVR